MKYFAILMATFVLAACGNSDNKSDTGDVHGDGRCTERYVAAHNLLNNNQTAERCEAFKANHGPVSCKLEFVNLGKVEETSYNKTWAKICEPKIKELEAQRQKALPGSSSSVATSIDGLYLRDLEPTWVNVQMIDQRIASENNQVVFDGTPFANGVEFLAWGRAHPDKVKGTLTICSVKLFKSTDFGKSSNPTKIEPRTEKEVILDFGEGKNISCKTSGDGGSTYDTTVGQLKNAFKNLVRFEVLKK